LGIGLINLSGRYVVPTGIERIRDHADKSISMLCRSHGHREDKHLINLLDVVLMSFPRA